MPVVELDDYDSSNGGAENSTETSDSDDFSELREAVEAVGGDADAAIDRVKNDDVSVDDLLPLAEALADSPELHELLEEYRTWNDLHRLKQFYLLDSDREFTQWADAFYGDSDDEWPDTQSYNAIQTEVRENSEGNLYFYKAMFPEPSDDAFPSDNAILLVERPDDDSDIYVTEEYVDAYSHLTMEIEGDSVPVPPWDDADANADAEEGGSDDDVIDPREMTVDEVKDAIEDMPVGELRSLLEVEEQTKDRKTAIEAIEREIRNRDGDDGGASSAETRAGEILAEYGELKAGPDIIVPMLESGLSKSEVVDRLS